ncbi:multicopper oxidase domain-containing protein [Streptosporangiaceae bacterium NEAU-GS5]|nr:multicopper oxidase domain-containing protein [Streptosporangiaceae bacterium NEAU-GS5]
MVTRWRTGWMLGWALIGVAALFVAWSAVLTSSGGTTGSGHGAHDRAVAAAATSAPNQTRVYFISADVVTWDYAPQGRNVITGQPFGDVENTYVKPGPDRIGSKYKKCLYRGYTDAGFRTLASTDPTLGFLGPVIRAQVGDQLVVVFRNTCPFPASIHPHGVFYAKNAEGAPYNDGTSGSDKADDAVPTGGTFTYRWQVPDRAGPGPMDGSSVMWMYHSHTDEVSDTYAGLIGPMEITARGQAKSDGSPLDVDREVFAMFLVANENASPFLAANMAGLSNPPDPEDEDFQESNLMHSINGYVYGNGPLFTMRNGQKVRWHVMSMGTEVDLHTPHWHGNTVTVNGMRTDVLSLLPAEMVTANMTPDDNGIWLFHCHVGDHITAGMQARYQVTP